MDIARHFQLGEHSRPRCFVIMPFGSKVHQPRFDVLQRFYWQHIVPGVGDRCHCFRADEQYVCGKPFTEKIVRWLAESEIVVADLSYQSPNVCWELGVRQSHGLPTILIARTEADIPSDLKSYDVLLFGDHANPDQSLRGRLCACVDELLGPRDPPPSPHESLTADEGASAVLYALGIRELWRASTDELQAGMLQRARNCFRFLGVSAQYMVATRGFWQARPVNGTVKHRFLLLNPSLECNSLQRHAAAEGRDAQSLSTLIISTENLLQEMQRKGLPVEWRFYSDAPRYRMMIADHELGCVGFYSGGKQGVDTPQMVLEHRCGGLLDPFLAIWEDLWERATLPTQVQTGHGSL